MTRDELLKHLDRNPNKIWPAVSGEKDPDTFSEATMKFQGTNYSHSLIIYYSLDLDDFVIGNAHGEAAQLDTIDQFYASGDEVVHLFELDIEPSRRQSIIRQIVELDGIDYSEMQIVNIGLDFFGIDREGNDLDGIICSEYADRVCVKAGLQSTADIVGKSIDVINPKDNVIAWEKQLGPNFRRLA